MAKKKKPNPAPRVISSDKPTTLEDLIRPEIREKLKEQAKSQSEALKAAEEARRQEERRKAEEARKAEEDRRNNDFAYLLENSKQDWKSYK
ncbi:YqkE family protein [Gorillibacterium timonense]|uniref:YqkE family protein n=1 Tax=Gorillibacterium timonense TaxID=1689269 RepID=UPI00071DE42E|nr:YqkE family protein [Gorillibacterium timonense]